jgi:hypothetical protein
MEAVFRPKDFPAGWRKRAQDAIKELAPDTKDNVIKIIDSWEDTNSEGKLKEILGNEKAESLLKKIRTIITKTNKSALTYDQQKQIQDMFRESLTFD